jgi:iron complex transport system substrate-binding protein
MSRRSWVALTLSAWVAIAPSACASHPPVNYFPDKSTIVDATNFTLSYHDSYQVLTVKRDVRHQRP